MATGQIEGQESNHNKAFSRKNHNEPRNSNFAPRQSSQLALAANTTNSSHHQLQPLDVVASDDSSSHNRLRHCAENATNAIAPPGYVRCDNLVKISLNVLSKNDVRVLKRKLASELQQVRGLVKKFEAKESRFSGGGYANSRVSGNENVNRGGGGGGLVRVNSDVGSVGLPSSRPYNDLGSVANRDISNKSGGRSELVGKAKGNPKANQFYKNSELKPMEGNKKMKPSVGKSNGGQVGGGAATERFTSQLYKSCSNLLGKLMKHKFGWVFHKPVDVKGLGLHDYYTIVKHPMDLGTVKTNLSKNLYKSPREFAEDVRLTFSNAMLYNPKGQDVHTMAETLLGIFEEKWKAIESEYNLNTRFERNHDYSLLTPTSRRVPAPPPASSTPVQAHSTAAPSPPVQPHATPARSSLPLESRALERSNSMTMPVDPKSRPDNLTPTSQTPVPKKPKAKDAGKRDMTFEEKQRLSESLQTLPSEKLDSIVQIIKKRNPSLFQQEDEIEVDIDSVDPETLWELHRFVTNYKKSLSKNMKKPECALQENAEDDRNIQETNLEPPAVEVPKVAETVERTVPPSPPVHGERQRDNDSGSSSSSSSSSDSGSSSSDSDSDSSSG